MNKRPTEKSEIEPGRSDAAGEPPPGSASTSSPGSAGEPKGTGDNAEENEVSWGPGSNAYGWIMTFVVLALLGGVAVGGFRLFGETVSSPESAAGGEARQVLERQVATLGADLCTASIGSAGAPEASVQIFEQKVHGPLHALADALAEEDRPAAATLLQKKFNVEQDIRRKAPPAELAASFAGLNEAVMDGLRILSLPSPACLPAQAPPPGAPPPAGAPAP